MSPFWETSHKRADFFNSDLNTGLLFISLDFSNNIVFTIFWLSIRCLPATLTIRESLCWSFRWLCISTWPVMIIVAIAPKANMYLAPSLANLLAFNLASSVSIRKQVSILVLSSANYCVREMPGNHARHYHLNYEETLPRKADINKTVFHLDRKNGNPFFVSVQALTIKKRK